MNATNTKQEPITVSHPETKAIISELALRGYYVEHQTCVEAINSYREGYSLLITGGCGTGKTSLFEAMRIPIINLPLFIESHSTSKEMFEDLAEHDQKPLVIDDIGSESNNFGKRTALFYSILHHRLERQNERTHFTTNLSGDELLNLYDARIIDRIKASCKCFNFSWKSYRIPRPNVYFLEQKHLKTEEAKRNQSIPIWNGWHKDFFTREDAAKLSDARYNDAVTKFATDLACYLKEIIPPNELLSELNDTQAAKNTYVPYRYGDEIYDDNDDPITKLVRKVSNHNPYMKDLIMKNFYWLAEIHRTNTFRILCQYEAQIDMRNKQL